MTVRQCAVRDTTGTKTCGHTGMGMRPLPRMIGVWRQTDCSWNQYLSRSPRLKNWWWTVANRGLASSRKKERLGWAVEVSSMEAAWFRRTYTWRSREAAVGHLNLPPFSPCPSSPHHPSRSLLFYPLPPSHSHLVFPHPHSPLPSSIPSLRPPTKLYSSHHY